MNVLKVVVIGGTGLIGSKVVANLTALGHQAVAASPRSGVDTVTGKGVADALSGAQVVVDVTNSPSFADDDVMDFFTRSTGNLIAAERATGVAHHVALSVVGSDRNPRSGYLRAKDAQERLIAVSGIPYSIVRATQFYEFAGKIADSAMDGDVVRLPHALMQPMAADDVATAVTRAVVGAPANGVTEVAGPEQLPMDEFVRTGLEALGDARRVVVDPQAPYFGEVIDDDSIVPVEADTVYPTRFTDWLSSLAVTGVR
jgi:uncharacterized protein YbjT (DUF2867 family)